MAGKYANNFLAYKDVPTTAFKMMLLRKYVDTAVNMDLQDDIAVESMCLSKRKAQCNDQKV